MKIIRFDHPGAPDVLRLRETLSPTPGAGQVRVRQSAVGVNFVDVYVRRGDIPASIPGRIGFEGAGVVEALGPGVTGVAEGDRVAYFDAPLGAYADAHLVPADRLVALPPGISDELAASLMLKGLTVEYLVRRTYAVARGDVVVVTAAAGGVGQLLCQWLRHIGATVVAVVGSESKAGLLRARGLDTVLTPDEDLPEVVRKVSGGQGARVVYDGVGKATWTASLDSLARFGLMVSFGMSSGPVGPIDLATLQSRGSLFVTRPSVFDHMARRDDLIDASGRLFDLVSEGVITPQPPTRFALADAAQAHRALEDRATTGAIVLTTGA